MHNAAAGLKMWAVEYVLAVFAFGALLLLVGLIGGDLTYGGASIPKVGALPRFTTTVLGSCVLLLSLVLYVSAERATGPTAGPSATTSVQPRTDGPTTAVPPSPAASTSQRTLKPSPARPSTVLVQFGIALDGPMYAADVALVIDGETDRLISVDQATRERIVGVQLAPGAHRYNLGVNWIDTEGMEHLDLGSGSVTAARGGGYGVRVDGVGKAWLVKP